jgi:hypothetical protein
MMQKPSTWRRLAQLKPFTMARTTITHPFFLLFLFSYYHFAEFIYFGNQRKITKPFSFYISIMTLWGGDKHLNSTDFTLIAEIK